MKEIDTIMKIDKILNQFRVLKLNVKYIKGDCTGFSIDVSIEGYKDFLDYDLCNLSLVEIYNSSKLINDLFRRYAALFSIVKRYITEQEENSCYFLDELFTDLQEHFNITGISIDNYKGRYLYDFVCNEGEAEFLEELKEIFHYNRVTWLRELVVKLDQQKMFIQQSQPDQTPISFKSNLEPDQIDKLVELVNSIGLFECMIDITKFVSILDCKQKETHVTNNQILAYFFNSLSVNHFICREWQNVIDKNKLFKGKRGKFITAKNMSASLQKANDNSDYAIKITNLVKHFKKISN